MMGVLKDIELYLASSDRLYDDGVPSASIALLEDPSNFIQPHVITKGNENAETLYQACSISKAITALAVARLIDQGRLSYETKVVDHMDEAMLEDILDPKTAHLMELVTVGLLVSHRSGLSQHGFAGYTDEVLPNYKQIFAGRPPANTPRLKFLSFPGSQHSYSGGGFTVLQLLLERVTGMRFAEFMRVEILEPLGMSRSVYGDLPEEEKNFAIPHATAYTPGTIAGKGYHRFTELAAAGLWTTPSDLLKAMAAIQNSLYSNDSGNIFLTQQAADHMLARVSPNDPDNGMSFGWFVNDTFFAHAGYNDPGYSCYVIGAHGYAAPLPYGMMKSPGRMSMAVMTNSALGDETYKRLVAAVMCLKAFPLYPTLPSFGKMAEIIPFPAPEGVYMGDEWKAFVGHWTDESNVTSKKRPAPGASPGFAGDGEWEIYEDNGLPYLAFDGVARPQRLIGGAVPWAPVSGAQHHVCLVVDGLEMALRLCYRESDGEQVIELVQRELTTLRRV